MMLMAMIRMVAIESRWLNRPRRPLRRKTPLPLPLVRDVHGLLFIDEAGIQVGVDRHLLARHRVESKAAVTSAVRTAHG